MIKTVLTTFLLLISSISYGTDSKFHNSEPAFKIGILELVNEFKIDSSEFESGKVSKSVGANFIRETTDIEYKVGNVFGVIIENLEPTKIKAIWTYPTISSITEENSFSKYTYPECSASDRHFIYWIIDEGEKEG